jgi:hypothetical protein
MDVKDICNAIEKRMKDEYTDFDYYRKMAENSLEAKPDNIFTFTNNYSFVEDIRTNLYDNFALISQEEFNHRKILSNLHSMLGCDETEPLKQPITQSEKDAMWER